MKNKLLLLLCLGVVSTLVFLFLASLLPLSCLPFGLLFLSSQSFFSLSFFLLDSFVFTCSFSLLSTWCSFSFSLPYSFSWSFSSSWRCSSWWLTRCLSSSWLSSSSWFYWLALIKTKLWMKEWTTCLTSHIKSIQITLSHYNTANTRHITAFIRDTNDTQIHQGLNVVCWGTYYS